jgi:hypothetical protein
MPESSPPPRSPARTPLREVESLAWLLDSSIPIPGLRMRIGVESLLGLIPVLGDALGALLSTYILVLSAKLGAPRVTLLRMSVNVAVEAAVGVVPLLGDVFDFVWKANTRNVDLLRAHLADPTRARRSDWLFTLALVLTLLVLLTLLGWAAYSGARLLAGLFRD